MARKNNTRSNRVPKYEWIGHISVYFNDDEAAHVMDYVDQRTWDIEDAISVITQGQYAIKFSYDVGRDAYYLTLQPKAKDNYYRGYTIGLGHVDILRLVQIASYVINELIPSQALELPPDKSVMSF